MKKFAMLMAVVMMAVFSASVIVAGNAPETATIKDVQKAKSPVIFPHKAHADRIKNCAECHHKDAAGKEQKCDKCHGDKTEGKKLSLKEAFHTQCKDCHKKSNKGPFKKCDDCHKK